MTKSPRSTIAAHQAEFSELLSGLNQRLRTVSGGAAVAAIAQAAVYHVDGARWASVTLHRPGQSRTLVVTAPIAQHAQDLQHELGFGPAVDPVFEGNVYVSGDLARDRRWPAFGPQAHDRLGLASLLTCRVSLPEDPEAAVGLTLYSDAVGAFDGTALWAAGLLASQAALAVTAQRHHEHVQNLERGLASNREIGAAVGVLMARYAITGEQAFEMLRATSQSTGRKFAAIAADVLHAGELTVPPMPPGVRPRRAPEASA